jgi:hypothetical protein
MGRCSVAQMLPACSYLQQERDKKVGGGDKEGQGGGSGGGVYRESVRGLGGRTCVSANSERGVVRDSTQGTQISRLMSCQEIGRREGSSHVRVGGVGGWRRGSGIRFETRSSPVVCVFVYVCVSLCACIRDGCGGC